MLGENPGVRILWLWAIGTAGGLSLSSFCPSTFLLLLYLVLFLSVICFGNITVMVTTVVKSRLRDMEALMDAQSKQAEPMVAEQDMPSDGRGGEIVKNL